MHNKHIVRATHQAIELQCQSITEEMEKECSAKGYPTFLSTTIDVDFIISLVSDLGLQLALRLGPGLGLGYGKVLGLELMVVNSVINPVTQTETKNRPTTDRTEIT